MIARITKQFTPGINRLAKGVGANGVSQIITAISSIILVTLFINAWGPSGYGHWLTLFAAASYLTLLDLGGQSFIGNLLAKAHAQDNDEEFRSVLSEGLSFYSGITLIGWVTIVVLLFLPLIHLPGISSALSIQDRLVLFALGTLNLIAVPAGVFVTIYRSTGRIARGMMIGNLFRIITLLISIVVLLLKLSPVIYAFASLIIGIVLTIVLFADSRLQISKSHPITLNYKLAKKGAGFLSGAVFFWLISIATLINSQGLILVLGIGAPATAIAMYSTQRTASGLLGYLGGLIQAPLLPEMTFFNAKGQNSQLLRITQLLMKVLVTSTGIFAIGLWIIIPEIYPLWTDHQLNFQPLLFFIFLVQGILAAGWMTAVWPLLASNQHKPVAYWSITNAIVTISLAIPFSTRWGVIGVALATFTGDLLCGLSVFPWLAARSFGIPSRSFYMSILWPFLIVVISGGLLISVISITTGWVKVVVGLFLVGLLILPMMYLTVGKSDLVWFMKHALRIRNGAIVSNES